MTSSLPSPRDCLEKFSSVWLKKNCSARYEVWLRFLWGTFLRNYFMVPFKRIFKDWASLTLDSGWARFVNNIQFFLFATRLSLFYTLILMYYYIAMAKEKSQPTLELHNCFTCVTRKRRGKICQIINEMLNEWRLVSEETVIHCR